MVGKKPKAIVIGPNSFLPIDLYKVSYKASFVYGSRRIIRDYRGRIIFNGNRIRTTVGNPMIKKDAEEIKNYLIEQGEKVVKLDKLKFDLPTKCPNCDNNGTPNIYKHKEPYRIDDKKNEIKRESLRLVYYHSKTRKTCIVGTVNLGSQIPEIKLKKGLPIDSLGHRRRSGLYPLE